MFKRDQKEISRYAQSSAHAMQRTITFVYLTIQQSIFTVPDAMKDVDRNGVESRFLWGFKADAYEWLDDHSKEVYIRAMNTWRGYADEDIAGRENLRYFASLPGLGLVKGGFVNQLVFGVTGCIDTHNQDMFEVKPYRFKASRYKSGNVALKRRMIADYSDLCDDVGGAEYLWNNWCNYVGERNAATGDYVSALHVKALGI